MSIIFTELHIKVSFKWRGYMTFSSNCMKRSTLVLYCECMRIILDGPNDAPISNSMLPPSVRHSAALHTSRICGAVSDAVSENTWKLGKLVLDKESHDLKVLV